MKSAPPTLVVSSPLYKQIKDLILASLQAGEWKTGELIPSEMELANHYGVSQGTVRKAIDELASEYLLVRKQGKGTYVGCHDEAKSPVRFLRLKPTHGERQPWGRQFLYCKTLPAPAEVAAALSIRQGSPVIEVRRLLLSKGKPVVFDDIWLPQEYFETITHERLSKYNGHMYVLFETECGVRMLRSQEYLTAISAPAEVAELLKVKEGSPLLQVLRTSYTYSDLPVEYRRAYYSTQEHSYFNELI